MIKNITAVAFALLLCATTFAKTPTVNENVVSETTIIADLFAPCKHANAVPEKVKTMASFIYKYSTDVYFIPAVFLPSKDSDHIDIAVAAKDLRKQKKVKIFSLSYSVTLIEGKQRWKNPTPSEWYTQQNNGCPKGMTPRYSRNGQEADICLITVPAEDLKAKFQQIFATNPVTPAMAAKALKRK